MKNPASLLDPEKAGVCPLLAPAPGVAHGIVSQAVLTAPGLRLTLFHFAAGQELSEHTTSARALVQVLAGACEFTYLGESHALKAGDLVHLPPGLPHAVRAAGDMILLVTQVGPPAAGK
jgi:quercetin dioxygenase-like cupin family protein